jgi:hypothetical protein
MEYVWLIIHSSKISEFRRPAKADEHGSVPMKLFIFVGFHSICIDF